MKLISILISGVLGLTLSSCDQSGSDKGAKTAKNGHSSKPATKFVLKKDSRFPASKMSMTIKQVSKHVYYIQGRDGAATQHEGFISNAGVIITPAGIIVVDALGSPSLARLMLVKIREISDKPIVKVIVTHYHADHIYGLQVFKDRGIKIVAPGGTWDYLASENARDLLISRRMTLGPWINKHTRLVKPDQIIDKDTSITLGGVKIRMAYLGSAHSHGDLTVYVETDKVLLSGDLIFEGRVPYVGNADTARWLKTLKQLETAGLLALVPGHGKVLNSPTATIKMNYEYLHLLRSKMKAAVDDFQSFSDAYKSVDWSRYKNMPAFKEANRGNAYRVYRSLEAESLK